MASSEDLEKINKELQLQIQQLRWQIQQMMKALPVMVSFIDSTYSRVGGMTTVNEVSSTTVTPGEEPTFRRSPMMLLSDAPEVRIVSFVGASLESERNRDEAHSNSGRGSSADRDDDIGRHCPVSRSGWCAAG